ncbi:hypothetical protein Taro_000620, partial [Colocasia esculenta]|nr:hypothetical protein [Colocasia esculenta]
MRGTINVITRIARSMNERLDAVAEVERYKMKVGIYGGYDITYAAQRLSPAEWWIQVNYQQAETNPLAYVAVRVLSQTTSSSPCERNWSTFSLIHIKIRNRLGVDRLEKLVYCHYNMRLRVKQKEERQKIERRKFMQLAGRRFEEVVPEIDVDELL